MTGQKEYRGYVFSRSIGAHRVPQHIQNLVIRNHAQKYSLHFLLSGVEHRMNSSYVMLNQLLDDAKDIDGNTPCHFCSEYGHRFCLKFLLTKNPYLYANNNEEKSAIDVAISGEILTVSLFFENLTKLYFCRNFKFSLHILKN